MAQSRNPEKGLPPPRDQLSAVKVAFPQTEEDFETDTRISYSKLDNKYILEDDDGQEFEWNNVVNKWIPVLDEAQRERQQQAYATKDEQSAREQSAGDASDGNSKKRKGDDQASGPKKRPKKPIEEKKNTAVYATSIPLDATMDEIASVFRVGGIIAESTDNSAKRIKMYKDEKGQFNGEALVIYFRPESIPLAIQMLDDAEFRPGVAGPNGNMRVVEADKGSKKTQREDAPEDDKTAGANFRKKRPNDQQKQIKAKTQKMNNKLADWSSDEEPSALTQTSARYDKVVVLYHMFTLNELEESAEAATEIVEDVTEEAEKLGQVVGVTLFDKEPRGVMTVRFVDERAAQECIKLMDGRQFGGRAVIAQLADGNERFKKSKPSGEGDGAEDSEADRKRLEAFEKDVEDDDDE